MILTKNELDSLQQLSQWDDIIITKADKGEVVTIIRVKHYILEAYQPIDNTKIYKKRRKDPKNLIEINKINKLEL